MNGKEVLRIVEAIHIDKNIDKEIVFEGIEQAITSAARKHFGEEAELVIDVDRETGEPAVNCDGDDLESDEIGDLLGRIAAQTAKQVMIQKIREAERDSLYDEYNALRSQIVTGTVTRVEHGTATVNLGKVEGILPRGEQIPGESHRVGERVRAIILDVRKAGSRVRIILSRNHPDLVRRLFEIEIPEVSEHVIDVRSLAREAGYRSKVAVSCIDSKIDCVGACVGVRGSRIRNIIDELAGERIDIVRWNDSLQVLVPNALQPAEVEDVILCPWLGKVIVLVRDDQLSLSIGKKGQNVRLASKLVGWDIHVMTQERLDEQLDSSVAAFSRVPGINDELAENLVSQGFFTFDDLSVIEPDQLAELGSLTAEQCDVIVEFADAESLRLEKIENEERHRARQEAKLAETLAREQAESGVPAEAATPEAQPEEAQSEEAATEGAAGEDAETADEAESQSDVAIDAEAAREEVAQADPPAEIEAVEEVRTSAAADTPEATEPQETVEEEGVIDPAGTGIVEQAIADQTPTAQAGDGEPAGQPPAEPTAETQSAEGEESPAASKESDSTAEDTTTQDQENEPVKTAEASAPEE